MPLLRHLVTAYLRAGDEQACHHQQSALEVWVPAKVHLVANGHGCVVGGEERRQRLVRSWRMREAEKQGSNVVRFNLVSRSKQESEKAHGGHISRTLAPGGLDLGGSTFRHAEFDLRWCEAAAGPSGPMAAPLQRPMLFSACYLRHYLVSFAKPVPEVPERLSARARH